MSIKMKKQNSKINPELILKYTFLFLLACVIGRIYELDLIISAGTLNYLKFFPTAIYTFIFALPYGVAGLVLYKIANVLNRYDFTKNKTVLKIIICVTVINLIELITGLIALKFLGVMPWDYSHHFLNFMGLISVPITVRWLIFVIVLGLFAYKPAKRFIERPLPKKIKKLTIATLVVYGIYLIAIMTLKVLGII